MISGNKIHSLTGVKSVIEIYENGIILKCKNTKTTKELEYDSLSSIFCDEATIITLGVIGFRHKYLKNHIDYFYFSFFKRKEGNQLYSVLERTIRNYKSKCKHEKVKTEDSSIHKELLENNTTTERTVLKQNEEEKTDTNINYNGNIKVSFNKPTKSKFASTMPIKIIYEEFIALDVETTGLDPVTDKIIEISLIKFKYGKAISSISSLINPKRKVSKKITELTGITNEMLEYEDTIEDILFDLLNFIGTNAIVAHNAMFDIKFLRNACRAYFEDENYYIENPVIDTLKLSRLMFKDLPNHKLPTILEHISFSVSESHRSESDALGAAQIYIRYCNFYNEKLIKKQKEFSQDELKCYKIATELLVKNNKSIDYLKYARVGKYIDIQNFSSILRIKLNGKKNYVLTKLDKKAIDIYRSEFSIEDSAKSETGDYRIFINSPEDIYKLESLILQSFDESEQDIKHYRENVLSAERKIQEYLMSV